MKQQKMKRGLALLLSVAMVFSMGTVNVFATEDTTPVGVSGIVDIGSLTVCEHTTHDEACGYMETVEGTPCDHLDEDDSYSCAPVLDSNVSGNNATPSDVDKEYVCDHTDSCGYTESAEGEECTHECELCKPTNGEKPAKPEVPTCDCTVKCVAEDTDNAAETEINADCPVCGAENADLAACEGEAAMPLAMLSETETPMDINNITTLNNSIKNATGDMEFKLTAGVTGTMTIPTGNTHNFTLDLNDKTLNGDSGVAIDHQGAGKLTIKDSAAGGGGKVTSANTTETSGTIVLMRNSTTDEVLIITGGTVENTAGSKAILNFDIGTVTVSGGTVESTNECAIYSFDDGKIVITGGKVTSSSGIAIYNKSIGTVTISGGTVESTTGTAIYNNSTGAITISQTRDSTPTTVTSANIDNGEGTICLRDGTAGEEILKITGGMVENTGAGLGSAIFNFSTGTVNIAGGTVSAATGTGSVAIYNDNTGTVTISGTSIIKGSNRVMDKAPTLDGVTLIASTDVNGTNLGEYDADDIASYKYIKAEKTQETLGTLSPSLTAGDGRITLAMQTAETGYAFYYTKGTTTVAAPTLNANINTIVGNTVFTANTDISSLTNGTKYYVQVYKANTSGEIKAYGEANATPSAAGGDGDGGGGDGGGGGGGGSSSGGSTITVTPPAPNMPNDPTRAETKVPATVGEDGKANVSITDKTVSDAINKAAAEAKKSGDEANGITLILSVTTGGKTATSVTVNLPKTVQEKVISQKIVSTVVVVDQPDVKIGMDLATMKEINKQANADVNITAARMDNGKLTDEAQTAIGNRPVFDLSVNYGGGKTVSSFGAGSVSVTLPYTLQAGEKAGNVYAVYVDVNGKVSYITGSCYDIVGKSVLFSTNHFSTYGVGYRADAPKFTDIANHWAENDIEFVTARGLFTGTSATTFSPNNSMTRGMFVTALGRLSGIDTSSYKTGSFTDVKADAYYTPYVNWAASKGITGGTTATTFGPDQEVTRQEMAVFMTNYAKAMGYTVPKTRVEVTFADSASIGSWAAEAVKAMQMAGVIMGKDSNRFDPTGIATRAEVSAVLHRYVELVIDRTTAQGQDVNDSGNIVYYENGRLFVGTKTIDGTTYHFGTDGICTGIDTVVPDTKGYTIHKIVYGDTLWDIAVKNKCTMAEIVELNGIKDPNNVPVGTELKIPQK